MGSDTGDRARDRQSRRRGSAGRPDLESSSEYPNLKALRQLLITDGDLLHPEQREAIQKAIRLIENIDFQGYSAYCTLCGDGVPIGTESPTAPIMCPTCIFWSDRIFADRRIREGGIKTVNFYTIRADGQHYTIIRDEGVSALMTVRLLNGVVIVTPWLKLQGPVPQKLRAVLPDNAVVIEGNPQELPIGVHTP